MSILNCYDDVEESKTYIDPSKKKLYSKEIEYKPFYKLVTRYDKSRDKKDFYIAMFDEIKENCNATFHSSNIVKIKLNSIWKELNIDSTKDKQYVFVEEVERDDNTIVYYLDI